MERRLAGSQLELKLCRGLFRLRREIFVANRENDCKSSDQALVEIAGLLRKAEIARNAHYMIAASKDGVGRYIHAVVLVGSSVVAILTFANYKLLLPVIPSLTGRRLTLTVGVVASLVFILVVIEEYARWREIARLHNEAAKRLTTFIRTAAQLKDRSSLSSEEVASVRERYISLMEEMPSIPDRVFFRAKKEWLMKVEISRRLEKTPFASVRSIRKRLREDNEKNDTKES